MAFTKITTDGLSDNAITAGKIAANPEFSGTEAAKMPSGTTGQRANAVAADIRFNTTIGLMEYYDGTNWKAIDSPPIVSSITPSTEIQSDDPQSIVISGTNFNSSIVTVIGTSDTTYTPDTTTINSSSQITITFAGANRLDGAQEPYDIKVTNASGLSSTLDNTLYINNVPTWTTTAGSLGQVNDGSPGSFTIAGTDPEGGSVYYSVVSGSLPTGLSLNTSTGAITGTNTAGSGTYNSSGVTYSITAGISDSANTVVNRTFSILKKWYDGSTSALAATSATAIYNISNSIPNGEYYINLPTVGATQVYCDIAGGGWMVAAAITTDGGNWKYEDSTWTGTGVLNASLTGNATFDNVTDRKYNTWNYFQASQLRLWHSLQNTLYTVMPLPSTNTLTWHFNNTAAEITLSYPNGSSRYGNGGVMCANWGINRSCSGTDVGTVAMRLGGMHKEGCYGFLGHGANSAASGANGVSAAQRNTINGYVRGSTTGNDGGCTASRRWDQGQIGNAVVWIK
jgi:hypothetical protein